MRRSRRGGSESKSTPATKQSRLWYTPLDSKLRLVSTEPKVALLAGSTGFVGGYLLKILLDAPDYSRVFALSRRPLGVEHPRLANRIVQFERMAEQLKGLVVQDAFCCLGTTIAAAGSEQAFRRVDVDYVLAFARAARAAQAQRLVVVSSAGADARAKNFYLRTKGEMEELLSREGFASLDILQPGLLLGWRQQMRFGELLARSFMPLVNPFLRGSREVYRGVGAETVARAMLGAARSGRRGVYRYSYAGLQQLAASRPTPTVSLQPKKKPT
jgi:uncharacterized protein YbjT (DUF2867 family)